MARRLVPDRYTACGETGALADSSPILLAIRSVSVLSQPVRSRRWSLPISKLTSIEFDASVVGLPSSAATNAVSLSANGLLLSFDTTISLPGNLVVADEDLLEWDGASFAVVLDRSADSIGPDRIMNLMVVPEPAGAARLLAGAHLLVAMKGRATPVCRRPEELVL